jgi:2-methylisocitrate lyase-like PEP mutase family enzyme
MSKLGWPDLGLVSLNDMRSNAEMIANLDPTVPLIADADTGFGGPVMVSRTVIEYARANVAALHIEDQLQTKRCGHLLGKDIVPREIFESRIRAAVNARATARSEILIIARTDSRQGHGFDEMVERMKTAAEIGADVVFPEGLQSKEEAKRVCEAMGSVPVLLNMVANGVTPDITVEEAKELGFRIVIFPTICLEAVASAVNSSLERLKSPGFRELDHAIGPKQLFSICGLEDCIKIDKAAGGVALKDV